MNFIIRKLSKLALNYQQYLETEDIFSLERRIMKFFGLWPTQKTFNWQFSLYFLIFILLDVLPKLSFLHTTFVDQNFRALTFSVPENLAAITSIFVFLSLALRRSYIQVIVGLLEKRCKEGRNLLMQL